MKKILVVLFTVILLSFLYIVISKEIYSKPIEEGVLVEKNDDFFMLETKEGKIGGVYPSNFNVSSIAAGDRIKVYHTGIILETYPLWIHTVVKIEKVN